MGVYIKGMKMPKSCDECRFRSDAWCLSLDDWRKAYNKPPTGERLDECPLVELPPHGRLIDVDELEYITIGWTHSYVQERDIRNAPTIIEAEGGADD